MNILLVYYSMYGHTLQLTEAAAAGVATVPGAVAIIRRVPELPFNEAKVQASGHARELRQRQEQIPLVSLADVRQAAGYIFGTPTRFGNMCAQMKAFFDQLSELWLAGVFEGKPAGLLVSTATMHGGQETTALTMVAPLLHLGLVVVGVPYSTPGMLHTEARGGTPYAATTVAGGRNELQPAPEDLAIARALGARVAQLALKLAT